MKILKNRFFILGNVLLLLIAIPVTLFFVKKQQEVRSHATPSTRLYFNPNIITKSKSCANFTSDITIDPGQNVVTTVKLALTYNPATLEVLDIVPGPNLTIAGDKSITSGATTVTYTTGTDPSKAIQSASKVATVTFRPIAPGAAKVEFSSSTRVLSQGASDFPTENVLSSAEALNVTVTDTATCDGAVVSPSPTVSAAPTPTTAPTTPTPTASASPTLGVNQIPICNSLTASPASSGSAPFSVLLTAQGNDPDGIITKASFTFGDGQVQNITDALNTKSATVQTNHTFQTQGTYGTTVIFTDDRGGLSAACNQTISVASGSGVPATPTATLIPTSAPTIPPTGSVATALGIFGAVALTIVGGLLLLAL